MENIKKTNKYFLSWKVGYNSSSKDFISSYGILGSHGAMMIALTKEHC